VAAWVWPAGLALLALAGANGAGAGERQAPGGPEALDAEMLRDLDLLERLDYSRDREVARRMRFLERLRMLEIQGAEEPAERRAPQPAGASK
jgi:hypothetical protein